MESSFKIERIASDVRFQWTKGDIDVFTEKQFHRHYELYFLLNGHPDFSSDRTRQSIEPNTLIVIPPHRYHLLLVEKDKRAEYERLVLNVEPSFLGGTTLCDALAGKELLPLPANHRIAEHFRYLKESVVRTDEADFRHILTACATDIVFLIKQCAASAVTETANRLSPLAAEMIRYINETVRCNPTVPEIAKRFSLSVSSASHLFKQNFGVSLKRYVIEKRMTEIRSLLQQGHKPQEVADAFGFLNYATFYRSYRSRFGEAPSHTHKALR